MASGRRYPETEADGQPARSPDVKRAGHVPWTPVIGITSVMVAALTVVLVLAALGFWSSSGSVKYSIHIASPGGSISRCATITGNAKIPPGYSLWIAQRAAAEKPLYNLNQVTLGNDGGWQTTTTVGPANATGLTFTIKVFALNAEASQLLSNLVSSPTNSFFYLQNLPQQVSEQASQNMTRNSSDTTACP
jgi:hypothetical protein